MLTAILSLSEVKTSRLISRFKLCSVDLALMRREGSCKRYEYPGGGTVRCPKCGAETEAVRIEEWDNRETTVHCSSCADVIERILKK